MQENFNGKNIRENSSYDPVKQEKIIDDLIKNTEILDNEVKSLSDDILVWNNTHSEPIGGEANVGLQNFGVELMDHINHIYDILKKRDEEVGKVKDKAKELQVKMNSVAMSLSHIYPEVTNTEISLNDEAELRNHFKLMDEKDRLENKNLQHIQKKKELFVSMEQIEKKYKTATEELKKIKELAKNLEGMKKADKSSVTYIEKTKAHLDKKDQDVYLN